MRYKFYKIALSLFLIQPLVMGENISFRAISTSGPVQEVYFESSDGQVHELKCNSIFRSGMHTIESDNPLVFFRMILSEDGKNLIRVPVGKVRWPQSHSLLLLIVTPSRNAFSFMAIEDAAESFPLGSIKVLNGSSFNVKACVGKKEAVIKPNQNKVLKFEDNNSDRGVYVNFSANNGDAFQKFYSNLWNSSSTRRTLVLLHNTGNARRPVGFMRLYENDRQLRRLKTSNDEEAKKH